MAVQAGRLALEQTSLYIYTHALMSIHTPVDMSVDMSMHTGGLDFEQFEEACMRIGLNLLKAQPATIRCLRFSPTAVHDVCVHRWAALQRHMRTDMCVGMRIDMRTAVAPGMCLVTVGTDRWHRPLAPTGGTDR